MKKNTITTILTVSLSVIAIIVLSVSLSLISPNCHKAKADGQIVLEYVNGDFNKKVNVQYFTGDVITDLVSKSFSNVTYKDGMIMSIEDYVTPEDWSTFICIYVNEQMSEVGLSQIKYENNMKISFVITKNNYS